ncbi:MAG: aldehyde dehydrogenase family protein [Saprospiraceae bacterium]|nr:aldehyde dehydrogenase family protein [Saprospiraceae bacterium]
MDKEFLQTLQIDQHNHGSIAGFDTMVGDEEISSSSPVDGTLIGRVSLTDAGNYEKIVIRAQSAFEEWRRWPAPKRGSVIQAFGQLLRDHKDALGNLVSYEMGKSIQEGLGEVQEMIDICAFSVGLSRQLYGLTMHSERLDHRMYEQWHPLGIVGIISAFNFPVAVWSWNAMVAIVCGNACIWKASEKTPLCAVACQKLFCQAAKALGAPAAISCIITGDHKLGKMLTADQRISLVSATGSSKMGKSLAQTVAARLGRSLLELGGNNAMIISKHADIDIAIRAAVFGAVGTAGQRCTSTRRLIIHQDHYDLIKERLKMAYSQIRIGNPLDPSMHMGPLIDRDAVHAYLEAIEIVQRFGGNFIVSGGVIEGSGFQSGCYVRPCIAEVENHYDIVQKETFAPILYLIKYQSLKQAIQLQNDVPQGLSSSIITEYLKEAELFLSASGSDCGIANVNIGTSGAEIGGAFGGEKETGGGRESGSDSWKSYMRRQTNTINYGTTLPLSQGITFDF